MHLQLEELAEQEIISRIMDVVLGHEDYSKE